VHSSGRRMSDRRGVQNDRTSDRTLKMQIDERS
jgi:hypothetical protein